MYWHIKQSEILGSALAVCKAVMDGRGDLQIVQIQAMEALAEWCDHFPLPQHWEGDHCGYLAAQYDKRLEYGILPTTEQSEAWNSIHNVDVNADRKPF